MICLKHAIGIPFAFLAVAFTSQAQAIPVDLELSLVIDISPSINTSEYNLQRQGYQSAFMDSGVQSAITSLPGGIATNVIFFSRSAVEKISWTHLYDTNSISTFASAIGSLAPTGVLRSGTDIADGYNLAINSFANGFEGSRKVIDISADGPQNLNSGCPAFGDGSDAGCIAQTSSARAAAEQAGIVVNGLAIAPDEFPGGDGLGYLQNQIITSTGFAVSADDFEDFADTITDKIFREITDPDPTPVPVPEPGTFGLLLLGFLAVTARRRVAR
ncbi:DUF1194 domain-containing protein [Marinobacter zhanjiangensis]|uniref:VWFA domain-containing protein n=1 Tax=Marinobacter zhanjiangensis TaxID=578215 RepID=A0ABQ3AYC6_9GAMM|nr:DUF1194 domain-containing protein [Marinobacter zhanjiangensis]GGY71100.1 hypothetical protein GCM10007071_17790 [Marinobacter zhanjiangensis]